MRYLNSCGAAHSRSFGCLPWPVLETRMTRPMFAARSVNLTTAAVSIFAMAACNPFRTPIKQDPVVAVSAHDVNANARWNGTLVSPTNLAGAVQMQGSVSMTPGLHSDDTRIALNLANATPGGVHPWQIHSGQCGSDAGVFGAASDYPALKVNDDGVASANATVRTMMPSEGNYYASVSASAANPETIVACGNLAPPSR